MNASKICFLFRCRKVTKTGIRVDAHVSTKSMWRHKIFFVNRGEYKFSDKMELLSVKYIVVCLPVWSYILCVFL